VLTEAAGAGKRGRLKEFRKKKPDSKESVLKSLKVDKNYLRVLTSF